MKRALDITVAAFGLLILSPLLLVALVVIWSQDFSSPFFLAPRIAKGGGTFRMVKLRSMMVDAHRSGVNSTADDDRRVTAVGRFMRRCKLDEVAQFWNVLRGDMSLVGPRPQVGVEVSLYTAEEWRMLDVRPGMTDLASIVFADLGDILKGSENPNLLYNQIVRPWKSRLALLYLDRISFLNDLRIIFLTGLALVSWPLALRRVQRILEEWGASELVREIARREKPLMPYPPPGATEVVACLPGNLH
jgi:lipopolysaccharide/colanic/teichoic acid biosynthesis glycosyltransferase